MALGSYCLIFYQRNKNKYMKFHLRRPIPWFQIMKITFSQILIAILLTTIAYSNSLKAQDVLNKKVNLTIQNASLADVLNNLHKNNNVKFIYSKSSINVNKKVSVNVTDVPLKEVLDQVLTPNGIDYEVLKDRIVLGKSTERATKTVEITSPDGTVVLKTMDVAAGTPVTGKVVDDKGLPIIGATVAEKGTTNGILTDVNGNYKLNVAGPNSVLVISFIGYRRKEITVGNQSNISVTLEEEINGLNEVVVVGYGTQKKSVTTGAISGVSAKDFAEQPAIRVEQILQGRTSGLTITTNDGQPGDGGTVRVRGITSFNNNDPLWVVDGVVVDNGGISYLNQSDIESIEVLKDAASQAIYGTRAATGVILVTTKKGKAGNTKINYSGFYGSSAPIRKLHLLNATEYATIRNESVIAGGGSAVYANPAALGQGTDWQSLIFNNSAKQQDHEINISGGNDKNLYYTSFGYLQQDGIVATDISKYKRINFRLNETYKPAKWITIGENVGYTYNKSIGLGATNSEFGGPLSSAINLDPITQAIITDPAVASAAPYSTNPVRRNAQGYPYGISSIVGQEITNPLAYETTKLGNYGWGHNIVGNTSIDVSPIKGLVLRSTLGTKIAFYGDESFNPVYYLNSSSTNSQNNYVRNTTRRFDWNIENTASYTREFNKHSVNVLIGQGAYADGNTIYTGVTYYNLPVDNFNDASLNFSIPATNRIGTGSENEVHHISSLFARVNYNYDERYIVQGIIRRDGSSRFGANYKYGTFPSFSLGWVPTKESFWKQNNVVNFIKIRGGYGVVGSDAIAADAFLSTIGGGRNYSFGTADSYISGYSPNAPSNPNLRWEETAQTNIGADLILFNDLSITAEWFKKKTSGILQSNPIPSYVGAISNPLANIGDMENTGEELQLSYHRTVGGVNWGLSGNISHIKNKVTNLGTILFRGGDGFQNIQDGVTRTIVGQPYQSFYGYQSLGIFQTQAEVNSYVSSTGTKILPNAKPGDFKWVDLDGDGKITPADRTFIGNPLPTMQYGVTLTAAYKGFDALVFAQGQSGNKIFQGLHRLDIANSNYTTAILNRWTGPGTSNTVPRVVDGDPNSNFSYNSAYYLEDGAYLRLKTVQVGYTLPLSLTKKIAIQRARIYLTGQNLLTFTKYTGYDPDITGGIDRGLYGQARTYLVGLSIGF
jgi:TonB-linked SusC/RagA family outer membrane protein